MTPSIPITSLLLTQSTPTWHRDTGSVLGYADDHVLPARLVSIFIITSSSAGEISSTSQAHRRHPPLRRSSPYRRLVTRNEKDMSWRG